MEKELEPSYDSKKKAYQSCKIKVQRRAKLQENSNKTKVLCPDLNIYKETDEDVDKDGSYWNFMFCPFMLVLCICFVSPVILVPQHDGLLCPDFWYELMINANLSFCLALTLVVFYDIKTVLNMSSIISKWSYLKMYLVLVLSFDILYCILCFTWTNGLGYNYPVPFSSVTMYITSAIYFTCIWYQFPKDMRCSNTEGTRIKSFCYLYLYSAFVSIQISGMRKVFAKVPSHLQWIMAFLLPTLRYINEKMMQMLARRAAGSWNLFTTANVSITMNVYISMFVAIALGSIATPLTSYSILGVDFLLNFLGCINIIRIHRRIDPEHSNSKNLEAQKRNEVTILALTEIVEILVPMLYLSTFMIAYYGPNALILGGIKNSYWNFEAVEDLESLIKGNGLIFVFDIIFGIVSGVILWKFAKLNMIQEYCIALKKFWPIITLRLAANTAKVMYLEFHIEFHRGLRIKNYSSDKRYFLNS